MRESSIQQRILLACSKGATRLFRNSTGVAWAGSRVERPSHAAMVMVYPGDVVVRKAQPLTFGLAVGSADLIGWSVRDGVAVFTAIECKSDTGRATPEQLNFIRQVQLAGGLAGLARSVEDAERVLTMPQTSV